MHVLDRADQDFEEIINEIFRSFPDLDDQAVREARAKSSGGLNAERLAEAGIDLNTVRRCPGVR